MYPAFVNFFTNNTHCVLTACDTSVAVWKMQDVYYTFDSHARDENGRNPDTSRTFNYILFYIKNNRNTCFFCIGDITKSGKLGTSCTVRFASLSELSTFLVKNLDQKTSTGVIPFV